MKKIHFPLIFLFFISLLFAACDGNREFEKYHPIPKEGWHKDSLVVFNIPIVDTLLNHNLYINVRNDVNYNYSNLWLFIEINQPGNIAAADTFEISLADPSGKWLGEGFGGIKTQQQVYKRGVYFPVSGEFQINVLHGMREEYLKGITDIGFRVEKIK